MPEDPFVIFSGEVQFSGVVLHDILIVSILVKRVSEVIVFGMVLAFQKLSFPDSSLLIVSIGISITADVRMVDAEIVNCTKNQVNGTMIIHTNNFGNICL